MKQAIYISIFITFFSLGCAGASQRVATADKSPALYNTAQILDQLPAQNAVEELLLLEQLVKNGHEELVNVAMLLESPDTTKSTQAKFAIHGLTRYVAKADKRDLVARAFGDALLSKMSDANKLLLMAELQKIAGPGSIAVLAQFLQDDYLTGPASRALVAVAGPEPGPVLLEALKNNSDQNRIHIIQALGRLNYSPAGPVITDYVDNKNLKAVSLQALSNLDYKPAAELLKTESLENPHAAAFYVDFASRLAQKGDSQGLKICSDILNGDYPPHIKLSALSVVLDVKREGALDELAAFVQKTGKKERMGALRMAEGLGSDQLKMDLVQLADRGPADLAADVVRALANSGNSELGSSLLRFLVNEKKKVRLATVEALPAMWGKEFGKKIFYHIQFPGSSSATQAASQTVDRQKMVFEKFALDVQLALTKELAERRVRDALPFFRSQVSGRDELALTSIEALGYVGDESDLDALLKAVTENSDISKRAQTALVLIVERSKERRDLVGKLDRFFDALNPDGKKDFLPIYRKLADKHSLARVISRIDSENGKTALGLLASWPSVNALPAIVELAEKEKNERSKERLIRGAVRMLNQNNVGDIAAFDYCTRLYDSAASNDQKKMIIAQMGKINSAQSIRFLTGLLDNLELGPDAAKAIIDGLPNDDDGLSQRQLAAVLLEGSANKSLLQSIEQIPLVETKLNKPPRGFVSLFNGYDLTGWKGLVADPPTRAKMSAAELAEAQKAADEEMRQHWKVVDGVLYFDGKGRSLATARDYQNFEMLVDWKIEGHGDSGIYLRGSPQVQIWDTADWPEGSGGLYNNKKNPSHPLTAADKPIGEWNTFRIRMVGERVTVYLNDVLVVDNVVMENYWERDKPIYPSGQIELQSHSTPLYFRNIFIRELPATKEPFSGQLFNGNDLSGWHVTGSNPDAWKVANGILYTEGGGGGYIYTDRQFADFVLELEFRLPPNGNSGVGLRAPGTGDPAYVGLEIQVLDDYGDKYTQLKPWQYTGSIYGVQPPSIRASKKAGQWQKMKIVCVGPKVDVYLNGQHTVDANLIEHMDQEKRHPGLKRRKGYIGLQNHSTRIEYRNIILKEL